MIDRFLQGKIMLCASSFSPGNRAYGLDSTYLGIAEQTIEYLGCLKLCELRT